MLFLGRGLGYPIALEGALKLKEIAYIHAEGYAAGEMKHGPSRSSTKTCRSWSSCRVTLITRSAISNVEEVRARDGQVIAIATEGDREIERVAQHVVIGSPRSTSASPRCSRCCLSSFSRITSPISRGPTSISLETWRRR